MKKERTLLILVVIALLVISCSIPSVQFDGTQATSIAKTVEAVSRGEVGTPNPNSAPGIRPAGAGDGQSQRPTPTMLPTKPAPTAGANSSAPSSENLSVSNVNYSPSNTVYYGNCGNGEETLLHVEATISPLDKIKEVLLWADIADSTGIVYSKYVKMWQLGIGDYAGDIDMGQIAPGVMNDPDGSVTFYLEVVDKNNASMHSNAFSLSVWQCGGGVLGPPPGGDADIRYFVGPASANAGDTIQIEWEVWDACKVFLDGNEVHHNDISVYAIPSNEGSTTYSHTLIAWGASCDNSSEKTAQVSIAISASGGGNNGGNNGGASSITIHNNSSHAIVEFQLDGNELIWSEADSILPGVSEPLTGLVSGQSYSYQVGAGFWSGGQKYSIYPLAGGTFTPESGSITIYDPSIEQIMTQYGGGGYFGGSYWDGTTPYCAAFNFYSNGSFDFYIDGNWNDSGSYSLVQRMPGSYAVEFNVVNSAGTESFNGTYYYSGAAAGTMYMNNGPAGWEQIEYIYNGGC